MKQSGSVSNSNWSEQAMQVLKERYLLVRDGVQETPEEMCDRVGKALASCEATTELQTTWGMRFSSMIKEKKFLPNSPCLQNAGLNNNRSLFACYVLPVEDSLDSIYTTLKNSALVFQAGGGVGYNFSNLRPRGSSLSGGGTSSGPCSFMQIYDASTGQIKQSSVRRGAMMGILNCDHPDIEEFIDAKRSGILTNFNVSVACTDAFMTAIKNNTEWSLWHEKGGPTKVVQARYLWDKICDAAWATADPGLLFIDTANNSDANPTPELERCLSTNPCVPGNTNILTRRGYFPIIDLVGKVVEIWNGMEWSMVNIRKTGIDQPLKKVVLSDGTELTCTPEHEWVLRDVNRSSFKLPTKELPVNSTLRPFEMPIVVTGKEFPHAYTHGFFCGDGYIENGHTPAVLLYGEKKDLTQWLEGQPNDSPYIDGRLRMLLPATIPVKFAVPLEADLQGRLDWLAGLIDADGCVTNGKSHQCIQISSVNANFLRQIRLMLTTMGVRAKVSKSREAGERMMPDGKGGSKLYPHQEDWRLLINSTDSQLLQRIGLTTHRVKLSNLTPQRDARRFVRVVKIEDAGRGDTYCFTEPKNHTGCFEGIITGQCGEQWLGNYDACCLGSINFSQFVNNGSIDWDELEKVTRGAVRMLDNMITVSPQPLEQIREKTQAMRRIGIGPMGWADTLVALGICYDTVPAFELADRIMGFVHRISMITSFELGEEKGAFPNQPYSRYKNATPLRNSCVTNSAPTGTISIIAGCSSGIEPLFALSYVHDNKLGRKMTFLNPAFKAAWDKNNGTAAMMNHVRDIGSLDGFPAIAEWATSFKTAGEISPEDHIKMQSIFQRQIQNAVSKTCNVPSDATVQQISDLYMSAYDSGCKGITVYRDGCKGQVLNAGVTEKKPNLPVEALVPRPDRLSAVTERVETPVGTAYISISHDDDHRPLEVFATVGKGGTDISSVSEALGRLVSLILRMPSTWAPRERVEHVIDQLANIGGGTQIGLGPKKIRSLPDAIARVLANFIGQGKDNGKSVGKLSKQLCIKCGNATLVPDGGCETCIGCGYSKCS